MHMHASWGGGGDFFFLVDWDLNEQRDAGRATRSIPGPDYTEIRSS